VALLAETITGANASTVLPSEVVNTILSFCFFSFGSRFLTSSLTGRTCDIYGFLISDATLQNVLFRHLLNSDYKDKEIIAD
jgi:hypothetical protein